MDCLIDQFLHLLIPQKLCNGFPTLAAEMSMMMMAATVVGGYDGASGDEGATSGGAGVESDDEAEEYAFERRPKSSRDP